MQLGGRLATNDPARALQIARATLPQGVSWGLIGVLSQMQQKDPKSALILYQEMVKRIKDEDLKRNQAAFGSAWNLVSSFQPPRADEDTFRDLIATLINAALAVNPVDQPSINSAQNISNQINSVMPQIEKYAPTRVSALRQWSENVESRSNPILRMYREMNQISQSGTVEDLRAAGAKYPPEFQNQLYQQAAWKAFSSGDSNRARQIISDYVSDPVQRKQILISSTRNRSTLR